MRGWVTLKIEINSEKPNLLYDDFVNFCTRVRRGLRNLSLTVLYSTHYRERLFRIDRTDNLTGNVYEMWDEMTMGVNIMTRIRWWFKHDKISDYYH